jgi:hypothetical protein
MPSDPIRENIFQDIKTAIQAVSGTPNYFTIIDSKKVNIIHSFVATQQFDEPYVYIYPGDELVDPDMGEKGKIYKVLQIDIEGWLRADDDMSTMNTIINRFIHDIEKCLMIDPKRNGNAIDTRIVSNSAFLVALANPKCGVIITIEIDYMHDFNDPSSTEV